jgi:hypothetical protein
MPMKTRKFYPLASIKRLDGRDPASLNAGEKAALLFAMRRVTKAKIAVVGSVDNAETKVSTAEELDASKARTGGKIRVKL